MLEFLTFEKFISYHALIVFYYIGAVILPIIPFKLTKFIHKIFHTSDAVYTSGKEISWKSLNGKQKLQLSITCIFCFLVMELFWRMIFEFLIAYIQIHDSILSVHT
jgi:hypothetical protein